MVDQYAGKFQIARSCRCIVPILAPGQRHGRGEMNAPGFGRAIEALDQEGVVIVREPPRAALRNIQPTGVRKRMKDLFPGADVMFVPDCLPHHRLRGHQGFKSTFQRTRSPRYATSAQ
jgi:hypothetical protein